ncbi:AraC family transcriptional regulator [Ruminococcaceae bacterium OttesenSCG-928-L11]|nr:AraC family transcriptional regulator [Ruminococcaceae bacterium OttesenSCG-928-L11]
MRIPKTFRNYLLSYIIIFSIPTIILAAFCYSYLLGQFRQMIYNAEAAEQQKQIESVEINYERIRNTCMQFGLQYQITYAQLQEDVNVRRALLTQLQNLQLPLTPYIQEVILWVPGHSYIYSSMTSYTIDSYRQIHGFDLQPYLQELDAVSAPKEQLICGTDTDDGPFYYICNYPYQSLAPWGRLILKLDIDAFTSMLPENYVLYHQGSAFLNRSQLSDGQISAESWDESPELIISNETSNQFRLLTVLDMEEAFADLNRAQHVFLALVAGVSLLSAVCLYIFSYRNYKPINELDQALDKLGVLDPDGSRKSSEVVRAIASMEQLDQRLLKERNIARGLWLSRLISSQGENLPRIRIELEGYGVTLDADEYAVAVLQVDRPVQANQYFDKVAFVPEPDGIYYYIDARGHIILLIAGVPGLTERLSPRLATVIVKLEEIGIHLDAYVGEVCTDLSKLYNSYVDALLLMDSGRGCNGAIHYSWLDSPVRYFLYPKTELGNLSTALARRDPEEIKSALRILSCQMDQSIYKEFLYKTICYEIANLLLTALDSDKCDGLRGLTGRFIWDLNSSYSNDGLVAQLQKLEDEIIEAFEPSVPAADGETIMESVLAYIHEHHRNPNFYLGQVADTFHISSNNLSQQFKRAVGVSPGKYVTALRIEAAKKLLVETALPVKEIALQVGFGDASSFIRKFKSITSVTPNQYRERK